MAASAWFSHITAMSRPAVVYIYMSIECQSTRMCVLLSDGSGKYMHACVLLSHGSGGEGLGGRWVRGGVFGGGGDARCQCKPALVKAKNMHDIDCLAVVCFGLQPRSR